MTGTLQPCSPLVSFTFPGYGGAVSNYGPPLAPPSNTSLNWAYTDLNTGWVYYWSVNAQGWTCQYIGG